MAYDDTNTDIEIDSGGGSEGDSSSEEFETTEETSSSVNNEPVPAEVDNDFEPVYFTKDALIYDPSYIHKFKGPTLHKMLDRLNQLAIAVTDLQTVVTNLIDEGEETREVIDNVWQHTTMCCTALGIDYQPKGEIWDGEGVLEEGVDPFISHIIIK